MNLSSLYNHSSPRKRSRDRQDSPRARHFTSTISTVSIVILRTIRRIALPEGVDGTHPDRPHPARIAIPSPVASWITLRQAAAFFALKESRISCIREPTGGADHQVRGQSRLHPRCLRCLTCEVQPIITHPRIPFFSGRPFLVCCPESPHVALQADRLTLSQDSGLSCQHRPHPSPRASIELEQKHHHPSR